MRWRGLVIIGILLPFFLAHPQWASADGPIWMSTGSMAVARRDHTATLLNNGKVLIVGWFTTIAELYDPVTGTFSPTGMTVMLHGQGATATRLPDGRVLVAGGNGSPTFAELYDPANGTFSPTGGLNASHIFHTATLLPNGTVLVAGGQDAFGTSAELYNPATGTFSLTGSLKTGRNGAAASLLLNGRVLIAGGFGSTTLTCLNSAEIFDPASGTFSITGSMTAARCSLWWSQAPVLGNGKVLIVGGLILQSAELFDPVAGTFTAVGNMTVPRAAATATLLPNGEVLIAGGATAAGPLTTNLAELFHPLSGTFSATASMNQARQQHTATVLPNGQVLVTGGFAGGAQLSSAEIFVAQITVVIDIKPGSSPPVPINTSSQGLIPVAILSSASFDAPAIVDKRSVTFGRTGNEASLAFCNASGEDVNGDGLLDLVCHFFAQQTGFQPGDTVGVLQGNTVNGMPFRGTEAVQIVH